MSTSRLNVRRMSPGQTPSTQFFTELFSSLQNSSAHHIVDTACLVDSFGTRSSILNYLFALPCTGEVVKNSVCSSRRGGCSAIDACKLLMFLHDGDAVFTSMK